MRVLQIIEYRGEIIVKLTKLIVLVIFILCGSEIFPCSTFKLQKDKRIIYAHNLNQGDIGVPGLIFINKRGLFKRGRTWDEIIFKERKNPSSLSWISRYGSITFNNFGRDFPDGGVNEAGLYIWEMNLKTGYPKNDKLHKLNQMNWMQFVLDNFSSVEDVVKSASEIEIDGWGWHFFAGDSSGRCVAVEFLNGKLVVHEGDNMPVPALFNAQYSRELEIMKFYSDHGGLYKVDLNKPSVPRFVKTARLIDDFSTSSEEIVDYGFRMLKTLRVNDDPEWSVIYDHNKRKVFFRTRINPQIKEISFRDFDFSGKSPVKILNMDQSRTGNVAGLFSEYSNKAVRDFTEKLMFPIAPAKFFTYGGLTLKEFSERISSHTDRNSDAGEHFFKGKWESTHKGNKNKISLKLDISGKKDVVQIRAMVGGADLWFKCDHVSMIGKKLNFTFITNNETFLEAKCEINGDIMDLTLLGAERDFGKMKLRKQF